jgi:signal transduction histidine kinase
VEVDAKRSHVEINVKAAPHLPPLKADRNYLKQLLLNLILNGVQAMPEGGTLTLEAGRSNSHLSLWVTDTGIGIPEEMLPKIFEPYFTSKSNGSGLGLAIARRIAEAHGGTLTVESEVGNGSRFQASLPLEGPEK